MLTYLDTVLRISLHRLDVSAASLQQLIATTDILRKGSSSADDATEGVVGVIYEILSDALRLKSRVSSKTLAAMIEVCYTSFSIPERPSANAIMVDDDYESGDA